MAEKFVDPEGGSDLNSGDSDAAPRKTPPSATGTYVQGVRLREGQRTRPGRTPIGAYAEGRY